MFFIIGWLFYNSKSFIPNGLASPFARNTFKPLFFTMAPRSRTTQQSSCVNLPTNIPREQDELAGVRSNSGSNKAFTSPEAPTPPFVSFFAKDLFTKFIKVFMETTQAQTQVLAESQERPLKAIKSEIYWDKSYMECYHFCQQYKDHFKTSGVTGINCTLFKTSFLRDSMSIRWAQYKRHYKSPNPITRSNFKAFFQKNPRSSQAFTDSIWSNFRRDSQYLLEEA